MAQRSAPAAPFGAPVQVDEVNSPESDAAPCLSADGRTLYFRSDRVGTFGQTDIYVATRDCL